MARLDQIISEVNGDLQDCLVPVRDRFRVAMSEIFDYAVANPAQGSAATAQAAIATAFKVHYADGLVSPGITIESAVAAFNNRHGGAGTANQKWVTIRDFIVARSALKSRIQDWLEEGELPAIATLWYERLAGRGVLGPPESDAVYSEIRETTPGPTLNFITEKRWTSASLGKAVRKVMTNTFTNGRVVVTEGSEEVV